MPDLGSLLFTSPWALSTLALLPGLWWLLRVTPPRPRQMLFPPLRLLMGLKPTEDTPDKTPWWLLLLRMAIAALIILAAAGPATQSGARLASHKGLVLLLIDNGWAAASHWQQRIALAGEILRQAEQAGNPVLLVASASGAGTAAATPRSAAEARRRLAALAPLPYPPGREQLGKDLLARTDLATDTQLHWLSDGVDYGQATAFMEAMQKLTARGLKATAYLPDAAWFPLALTPPAPREGELKVRVVDTGPAAGARTATLRSFAADGRQLEDTPVLLAAGARTAEVAIQLPLRLRNRITRIEIVEGGTTGSVLLLDGRNRRKPVGLATPPAQSSLSLLAPLTYVSKAIRPITEIRRDTRIGELARPANDVIVLADRGRLPEADQDALAGWVRAGGMLIRFAGPHMAAGVDGLTPVRLRRGGRSLGGALSWDTPQKLAAFDRTSPFAGLHVPAEVTISRQVLAEPSLELAGKTWARLSDGTPLVTASKSGRGWLVLFHTTANADWSNLPLSGLFVEMMHRLIALAPGISETKQADNSTSAAMPQSLPPVQTLNGFGQLGRPPANAEPLIPAALSKTRPGPRHPPGYYGPEHARLAFNLLRTGAAPKPLPRLEGAAYAGYGFSTSRNLSGYALLAALILFLADGLIRLPLALRHASAGAALLLPLAALVVLALTAMPSLAQDSNVPDDLAISATRETHLAYVRTGNAELDEISRLGLKTLSTLLTQRTSFEPGEPIGVDITSDELAFFPFLYWPVDGPMPEPSAATVTRINSFMKSGGTILFDTRDAPQVIPGLGGARESGNGQNLRRLLARLDIPQLEPVPTGHVLGRSFYLLQSFPGRWQDGPLWTETDADKRISGILIGSNDYAAAWARNARGVWLYPVVPGGEVQREMAIRAGINIVLYALTGNYKADQVHVPAILQRLGR